MRPLSNFFSRPVVVHPCQKRRKKYRKKKKTRKLPENLEHMRTRPSIQTSDTRIEKRECRQKNKYNLLPDTCCCCCCCKEAQWQRRSPARRPVYRERDEQGGPPRPAISSPVFRRVPVRRDRILLELAGYV